MTTTKAGAYTTPACTLDEHAECPGPGETRLDWQTATQPPIETLHCACHCHQQRTTQ
ncbi:hypothetical protein ACFRKB_11585 [Streptomyces scopuliridis]|uniref:hypothetical protein n=1 Tax=Streptomyces scopuliridis TaxID=452529 RepID=UPI0036891556